MPLRWSITPQEIEDRVTTGLYRGAQRVMEISRTQYCPKRTGNLASTGEVLPPVKESSGPRIVARYTADYAIHVHERNLQYINGQWKYLSTPALENGDILVEEVQKALGE